MTFEDLMVSIDGEVIYATKGNLGETVGYQRIEALGNQGAEFTLNTRPQGTFGASMYIKGSTTLFRQGLAGLSPVEVYAGEYGFPSGFMNNFSLSAAPNSLVGSSVNFTAFSKIDRAGASDGQMNTDSFAHGGTSIPTSSLFNGNLFSFEYSLQQSVTPRYYLGEENPSHFDFGGGTVSCRLEGSGIGAAVDFSCPDSQAIGIELRDVCGNVIETITEDGMKIESSDLTIDPERGLVGTIELTKIF